MHLRETRGAPYYQLLHEFFPNDINKFVEEGHTCTCYQCGKELQLLQAAALLNNSTEQSSNPQQIEETKQDEPMVVVSAQAEEQLKAKDARISDLEKDIESYKILTKDYCKQIDKLRSVVDSEDRFIQSSTYQQLIEQTKLLTDEILRLKQ